LASVFGGCHIYIGNGSFPVPLTDGPDLGDFFPGQAHLYPECVFVCRDLLQFPDFQSFFVDKDTKV
jgi:hypothetical protein